MCARSSSKMVRGQPACFEVTRRNTQGSESVVQTLYIGFMSLVSVDKRCPIRSAIRLSNKVSLFRPRPHTRRQMRPPTTARAVAVSQLRNTVALRVGRRYFRPQPLYRDPPTSSPNNEQPWLPGLASPRQVTTRYRQGSMGC